MIWAALWSVAEPAMEITNSCIPMMRPVLKAFFPSLFASAHAYSTEAGTETGGRSLSSSYAFNKQRKNYESDSNVPLTLRERPGKTSRGDDEESSLNDRLDSVHSRSVIENG